MKAFIYSALGLFALATVPAYASSLYLEIDRRSGNCKVAHQDRIIHVRCSSGYYLVYWSGSESSIGIFDQQEGTRIHVAPEGVTKAVIIPYE